VSGNYGGTNAETIAGEGDLNADPGLQSLSLRAISMIESMDINEDSPAVNSGFFETSFNDTDDNRNDRGSTGGPNHNTGPTADFKVDPLTSGTSKVFTFDSTNSLDLESTSNTLQVRWDFGGDLTYDTEFSSDKIATHTYTNEGTYTVNLLVRDSSGMLSSASKSISVFRQAPNIPNTPDPSDESLTDVSGISLQWSGGDPDQNDTVLYDVYFGSNSNPPLVSQAQNTTAYNAGNLEYNAYYFWKVVVTDSTGLSV
jgi:PKD repeat protein